MSSSSRQWPSLLLLWSGMAVPPLAWIAVFSLFQVMTHFSCPQVPRMSFSSLGLIGMVIAALAALLGFVFQFRLTDTAGQRSSSPSESRERARFMIGVAIGLGMMFTVLIAVMIVPVFWLSGCPT